MNLDNQFIPNQIARISLAKKMNLEYNDSMQDWEYEISDSTRIDEFIKEYDKPVTTKKEKQSLIEILLDSLNELLLEKNNKKFEMAFPKVIERLKRDKKLHQGSLNYWILGNFEISFKLRNCEF